MPAKVRVFIARRQHMRSVRARAKKAMLATALYLETEIREKIFKPQPYRITPGGYYRGLAPSKPGQPPKRLTGRLVNSLNRRVVMKRHSVIGFTGTNTPYGRRLEDPNGMNRPHLRVTLEKKRKKAAAIFRRAFRGA